MSWRDGLLATDIWITIIEDRHTDVETLPFSSQDRAIQVAREQVLANARHPESIDWEPELLPAAIEDGWVFLATYGDGSECVRVVRRTLDQES